MREDIEKYEEKIWEMRVMETEAGAFSRFQGKESIPRLDYYKQSGAEWSEKKWNKMSISIFENFKQNFYFVVSTNRKNGTRWNGCHQLPFHCIVLSKTQTMKHNITPFYFISFHFIPSIQFFWWLNIPKRGRQGHRGAFVKTKDIVEHYIMLISRSQVFTNLDKVNVFLFISF